MTKEELEQKIQEGADNVGLRDFDKVWQEIEPKIAEKPIKKRESFWRWAPIAVSCVCVAVGVCLALPYIFSNDSISSDSGSASDSSEVRYLDTELHQKEVQSTEFYMEIEQSDLSVVDLSSFEFFNSFIYYDDNQIVKGGSVELYKEKEGKNYYFILDFYDINVEISNESFTGLELSYKTTQGAEISYKYKEVDNIYLISAEYQNVNYYMEYTDNGEDITQFFEEFFQ